MKDLEEKANKWIDEYAFQVPYNTKGPIANDDYYDPYKLKYGKEGFIAGYSEAMKEHEPSIEVKKERLIQFIVWLHTEWAPHITIPRPEVAADKYLRLINASSFTEQEQSTKEDNGNNTE
jgi:hypothetical protein